MSIQRDNTRNRVVVGILRVAIDFAIITFDVFARQDMIDTEVEFMPVERNTRSVSGTDKRII